MRHAALMRRAFVGTVQKVERCEIVGTAVVVLATFACSEHQSGILTGCRLARLNVHVISVHCDLSRHSYPTRAGSKVIALRREAKRIGEKLQLAPRVAVESTLCLMVVGNLPSEIECGGHPGHDRDSESESRASPATRSLPSPGSPTARTHSHSEDGLIVTTVLTRNRAHSDHL